MAEIKAEQIRLADEGWWYLCDVEVEFVALANGEGT